MKDTLRLTGTSLHQARLEHLALSSHRHRSKCPYCSCTCRKAFWHGQAKPDIGLDWCLCVPFPWPEGEWYTHGDGNHKPLLYRGCVLHTVLIWSRQYQIWSNLLWSNIIIVIIIVEHYNRYYTVYCGRRQGEVRGVIIEGRYLASCSPLAPPPEPYIDFQTQWGEPDH